MANSTTRVVEQFKTSGVFKTVTQTPGWVWVVMGGVALLIVGVVAATAAMHHRNPAEE